MRILAIGDFHGQFPKKLNNTFIKENNIDIVLSTGDFADYGVIWKYFIKYPELNFTSTNLPKYLGEKRFKEVLKKWEASSDSVLSKLNKLNVPIYTVHGNADYSKHLRMKSYGKGLDREHFEDKIKRFNKIQQLENSSIEFDEYYIFGYGGKSRTTSNKGDPLKFKSSASGSKIILLTHDPPYNVFDKITDKKNPRYGQHIGDKDIRKVIDEYQPLLNVCGHMHEYSQRKTKVGKTVVVNPGYGHNGQITIIELPKLKIKFVKI